MKLVANAARALHHRGEIDPDVGLDAKTRSAPRAPRRVRRTQKRLRRRAAVVRATSAKFVALEQHDAFARFREVERQRHASFISADDDPLCLFHVSNGSFSWP